MKNLEDYMTTHARLPLSYFFIFVSIMIIAWVYHAGTGGSALAVAIIYACIIGLIVQPLWVLMTHKKNLAIARQLFIADIEPLSTQQLKRHVRQNTCSPASREIVQQVINRKEGQ